MANEKNKAKEASNVSGGIEIHIPKGRGGAVSPHKDAFLDAA